MKSIPFDTGIHTRFPREMQLERMRQVIAQVLSPMQRQTLIDYYFHRRSIPQIAKDRGVHKSTVSRTLHRAEKNLREHLKY